MKKQLFLCLFFLFAISTMFANQKLSLDNSVINFNLSSNDQSGFTVNDAVKYAASAKSSSIVPLALVVTGAVAFVAGVIMLPVGASNYYYAGCGFGWWEDDTYDVHFLGGDNQWGFAGIYSGMALMVAGSIFIAAGAVLLVSGIVLYATTKGRASIYMESRPDAEATAFGISYKL